MKNLSKNKNIALIFAVLAVLATLFIFSNSLKVGEESSEQSNVIVDIIESIAEKVGITFDRPALSHFIRKLAHFSEYFLLSALSATAITLWFDNRKSIVFAPIYSLIVAICDEFVFQRITDGRSPQWTDVLIDFGGALSAMTAVLIIFMIIKNKSKNKK